MKKNYDERQQQLMGKLGSAGFLAMYLTCAASILIQLLFFDGTLKSVAGETVVLLVGGLVYLGGCVNQGLWTNSGRGTSLWINLTGSILCSAIFSILFAMIISRKVSGTTDLATYLVFFFIAITLLCFLTLTILDKLSKAKSEKQEQKYSK